MAYGFRDDDSKLAGSPCRQSVVLSLVSKKGGVGKTTTAVNLSAALAEKGKRVLLVDLDSQGSASLSLGFTRAEFAPSAADILLKGLPVQKAVRRTSVAGLDLVTSSTDLASIDSELGDAKHRDRILQSRLTPMREGYDFVILDCPPGLSLLSTNALVASDFFILPVMPQYLALEGVDNLLAAVKRLSHSNATRTRPLGILLTMVDYRTKLTRRNVDKIRREYRNQVFAIEVRVNIRLAEAPSFGKTIFEYDRSSTGAAAYNLLAEELLLRSVPLTTMEPSRTNVGQRGNLHLVRPGPSVSRRF